MDLPDTTLGLASGNVIFLDTNAAGQGWFVDPTPREDSEFTSGMPDTTTAAKVDLLTVVVHEMGHILGLDDDAATDPVAGTVMADVLPVGVRRIRLEGLTANVRAVGLSSVNTASAESAQCQAGVSFVGELSLPPEYQLNGGTPEVAIAGSIGTRRGDEEGNTWEQSTAIGNVASMTLGWKSPPLLSPQPVLDRSDHYDLFFDWTPDSDDSGDGWQAL